MFDSIYFAKMYEVQKYLSWTDHLWDGRQVQAHQESSLKFS